MVTPTVGSIFLVRFPFSDLSATKLRPAAVLAAADHDDWVLCQITSNPYADAKAIEILEADFSSGSLSRVSYARPGKLFTASNVIMEKEVGRLTSAKLSSVIKAVVALLEPKA